jgi:hypothetical protein
VNPAGPARRRADESLSLGADRGRGIVAAQHVLGAAAKGLDGGAGEAVEVA